MPLQLWPAKKTPSSCSSAKGAILCSSRRGRRPEGDLAREPGIRQGNPNPDGLVPWGSTEGVCRPCALERMAGSQGPDRLVLVRQECPGLPRGPLKNTSGDERSTSSSSATNTKRILIVNAGSHGGFSENS